MTHQATGRFHHKGKSLSLLVRSMMTTPYSLPVTLNLTLPMFSWETFKQPLRASLQTHFAIEQIPLPILDLVRMPRGKVNMAIQVIGTVAKPLINAYAELSEGLIFLPPLAYSLKYSTQRQPESTLSDRISVVFSAGSGLAQFTGSLILYKLELPLTVQLNGQSSGN